MRVICAALILLFALPAAAQDMPSLFREGPPAGVALNVNRFLSVMRARKRWSLRLGAAVAPDTNIGAGSDERIVYIPFAGQLLPFRRDQEELTTSGIGVSAWLGGEYQYPLGGSGPGPGQASGGCAPAAICRARSTGRANSTR